ncbi:MAG TPA: hypothetical protein DD640_08265, partial [Clostridiales bacterium]|nr:hypothetical protein [Clostridiales bacterium]
GEYLALLRIHGAKLTRQDLLAELDKLITEREYLMGAVERVRMKAAQYQCLRDMSIYRQFYLDLCDFVRSQELEEITLDLTRTDDLKSGLFYFLR